ncbi:MAG: hypothetical protein Fur0028_15620 [Bacteroidales bacterium]
MKSLKKTLDPLTIATIPGLFTILFLGLAIKTGNKNYILVILLFVVIFAFLFYKATQSPGLILENDFDGKVRFKPEEGCEPQELKELPTKADGINTGIKPGTVFKLRSGTNVYIDKSGNVRSYSPVSAWVNKWVSKKDFTQEELKCWDKLF